MSSSPLIDAHQEVIAYVPRQVLEAQGWLAQGFVLDPGEAILDGMRGALEFAPRGPLEEDPSKKQLIPYVVVSDGEQIYTMRRKSQQSESRLHGKLSFGVGGHINDEDELSQSDDPILEGLLRELHEEMALTSAGELVYRGVLNDDSNAVGQVHLGVVFTFEVDDPSGVAIREVDKMEGDWQRVGYLQEQRARLESWSEVLLPYLPSWFGRLPEQPVAQP